jgi:L-amino acid N-acyltransferase YncA
MPDITLRPAAPADIATITEIYADAVLHGTASYELEAPGAAEMAKRYEKLTSRNYPYLVAELGGRIAGYAYAGPFRERPAYRFTLEDSVYVDPACKGRGIGRLLLGRLIAESETLGFRQMLAVIGDGSNHRASVRLHEAAGFTHAGTIKGSGFKHGRWLDTVIMQLALNGGTATLPEN